MKNLTLFFLFFCFAAVSFAQNPFFERNYQNSFYNKLTGIRTGSDGVLFLPVLSDNLPGWSTTFLQIINVDPDGNPDTLNNDRFGAQMDYDIIRVADGYIATGNFFDCDYTFRTIYKLDFNGVELWHTEEFGPGNPPEVAKLLPGPDGRIWLFRPNAPPLFYDTNGDIVGLSTSTFPLFKNFIQLNEDELLTYGFNGLTRINNMLTTTELGLQGIDILKADTLSSGRVVALTADSLFVLNENFEVLKALKHGIPATQIADMDCNGDVIWMLTSGQTAALLQFNPELQLTTSQNLAGNGSFRPQFFHVTGNRVLLAGSEKTTAGMTRDQVISVRSKPVNAPGLNITTDASILAIDAPDNPKASISNVSGPPFTPTAIIRFDDVFVRVQNKGDGILQQVTLNSTLSLHGSICGYVEDQYRNTFYNLNLAPGDSTQIDLGIIIWERDSTPLIPTQVSLCFWTTLPNDSLDRDISNNYFCQNFGVTSVIGDPGPVFQNMVIFPNPTTGDCVIQLPENQNGTGVLRLFDGMGRLVETESFSVSNITLHRKNLPSGLYNLLITKENGDCYSGKVAFN